MIVVDEDLAKKLSPKPVTELKSDRQLHVVRYSRCGTLLVGGDYEGRVRRWRIDDDGTYHEAPSLAGHNGWVQALGFGASGDSDPRLFTSDSWGQLSAWNPAEETPQPVWSHAAAHDGWIRSLAVSPDGSQLATCGNDRRVRVWSASDGKLLHEFPPQAEPLFSVAFHPSGNWIASGDWKGNINVWDLEGNIVRQCSAHALYKYDRIQDVGGVWCLRFDREGTRLFAAGVTPDRGATVQGQPTVLVFDFESGQELETIHLGAANQCYVHDLFWHNDGFLVAVTSGTPGAGQLVFQRLGDKEPFYLDTKLANAHGVSLHPAGRHLAVVTTNRGSNGNGRPLDKDGNYLGNHSPVSIFEFAAN